MTKFHSLFDALNGGKGLSGSLGERIYSSWNGISYSRVLLSNGILAAAIEPKITMPSDSKMEFTWQVNPWKINSNCDDKAMIVVFNIENQEAVVITNGNPRESMGQLVSLPATYVGAQVVFYLAFRDYDGKMESDSQFLGCLKVE